MAPSLILKDKFYFIKLLILLFLCLSLIGSVESLASLDLGQLNSCSFTEGAVSPKGATPHNALVSFSIDFREKALIFSRACKTAMLKN